jgi:hypothetical protein
MQAADDFQDREVTMAGFTAFTWLHTILSLVALVAGIVVVFEMLGSRMSATWNAIYFLTALATSLTGFGFDAPFQPSHVIGILSLIALVPAGLGLYVYQLAGAWRWIFTAGAVAWLYFDAFVTVVQAFRKIPFLHTLAPTESEAPFAVAQLVVLVIFVWLIYATAKKFRPIAPATAH